MPPRQLTEIVSRLNSLAPHFDFLQRIARPCVDLKIVADPPTPECSRFGGQPFAPKHFEWPKHEIGEYRFLGQFNFAEMQQRPAELPAAGLLSLFYADDENGECFWGADGYVLGFYWEDLTQHTLICSPHIDPPAAKRLLLTGGIDLPVHEELRTDWPFDSQALRDLSKAIPLDRQYLLGYPSFNTLAYDPTPGPEWVSLLTVGSLDEFHWCWHDGDTLMVFIKAEMLARRDFSQLKSEAG